MAAAVDTAQAAAAAAATVAATPVAATAAAPAAAFAALPLALPVLSVVCGVSDAGWWKNAPPPRLIPEICWVIYVMESTPHCTWWLMQMLRIQTQQLILLLSILTQGASLRHVPSKRERQDQEQP